MYLVYQGLLNFNIYFYFPILKELIALFPLQTLTGWSWDCVVTESFWAAAEFLCII